MQLSNHEWRLSVPEKPPIFAMFSWLNLLFTCCPTPELGVNWSDFLLDMIICWCTLLKSCFSHTNVVICVFSCHLNLLTGATNICWSFIVAPFTNKNQQMSTSFVGCHKTTFASLQAWREQKRCSNFKPLTICGESPNRSSVRNL